MEPPDPGPALAVPASAARPCCSFLAVPVLGLRLGFSDEGNYPEESTTRQAYDLLSEGFGPGFNGPFLAVRPHRRPRASSPPSSPSPPPSAHDPGVASVDARRSPTTRRAHRRARAGHPDDAPQDLETEQLIHRLRDDVIPAAVGDADLEVVGHRLRRRSRLDFSSYLGERSLLFFGVVLALSFFLLMAVFRSLLVPHQGRDPEHAVDRRRLRRGGGHLPVGPSRIHHRRRAGARSSRSSR